MQICAEVKSAGRGNGLGRITSGKYMWTAGENTANKCCDGKKRSGIGNVKMAASVVLDILV